MKHVKRKKIVMIVFIVLFLILVVIGFALGNAPINKGTIYFSDGETAYKYDVNKYKKTKIIIDNYDFVHYFIPTEKGDLVVTGNIIENENDADYEIYYLIFNQNVLATEELIFDPVLVGDFVVYRKEFGDLCAINYAKKEKFDISKNVEFGYSVVDNYLFFSKNIAGESNKQNDIIVVDFSTSVPKKEVVDTGVICRNSKDGLVYTKNNEYYHYDFIQHKSVKVEKPLLMQDLFQSRYLGHIKTDDVDLDLHYNQKIIYDRSIYKNDNDYQNALLSGNIVNDDLSLLGFIKISNNGKNLFIPVSCSRSVCVSAYEVDNKLYYPTIACTHSVYA